MAYEQRPLKSFFHFQTVSLEIFLLIIAEAWDAKCKGYLPSRFAVTACSWGIEWRDNEMLITPPTNVPQNFNNLVVHSFFFLRNTVEIISFAYHWHCELSKNYMQWNYADKKAHTALQLYYWISLFSLASEIHLGMTSTVTNSNRSCWSKMCALAIDSNVNRIE